MNLLLGFCRGLAGCGSLPLEDWRPHLVPGSLAHIPSHAFYRALQPSQVRSLSPFSFSHPFCHISLPPAGGRSLLMAVSVSRALPILKDICEVSLAVEGHMFTGSREHLEGGQLCLPHIQGLACLRYTQSTFLSNSLPLCLQKSCSNKFSLALQILVVIDNCYLFH